MCGELIGAIKLQNQTKYKIGQVAVHQSLFMRASRRLICFFITSRQKLAGCGPNFKKMMGKAPEQIVREDEKYFINCSIRLSVPTLPAQLGGNCHDIKYL